MAQRKLILPFIHSILLLFLANRLSHLCIYKFYGRLIGLKISSFSVVCYYRYYFIIYANIVFPQKAIHNQMIERCAVLIVLRAAVLPFRTADDDDVASD